MALDWLGWAADYAADKELEMSDPNWMEHAAEKMKTKGTVGSFGKATDKKIAAGKKAGGKMAKKANFAKVAKSVARKRA